MNSGTGAYRFLAARASPVRGNVTAQVTDTLRAAIVALDFAPGETLDKMAICERLGVSRFPVSEALARLAAEGLVDILPQRGSTVSLIRMADVLEYMLIRKALEGEAVRVASAAGGATLAAALDRNMAYQRTAVQMEDRLGFHQRDLEFHELIFDTVGFARLKAVIESTRANLDRARRLILSPRRLEATHGEHGRIVAAIAAGDGARAALAMRAHIDAVIAELISFARDNPRHFADGADLAETSAIARYPFG